MDWLWELAFNLIGGKKQADAAKEAAELQNQAMEAQYEYDLLAWEAAKQSAIDKRAYAVQEIELRNKNEGQIAAHKDAMNAASYNYNMQIRNQQQDLNDRMYEKSEDIFSKQLGINAANEKAAKMDERRKLREIETENRYDQQDVYLEALETEGAIRARGQSGRSIDKATSVAALKASTALSLLDLSLDNATIASQSAIRAIGKERVIKDVNAYAAKMLDPGELPEPIKPIDTPRAEFLYPPVYKDYDFGPAPEIGVKVSPSAAASKVWGSTITSVAGLVGDAFSANTKKIPVYAMPRMAQFLQNNGPWSQLIDFENISIQPIQNKIPVSVSPRLTVTPLTVPHRDEFSETVGFLITGQSKRVLYIPDIDKWDLWETDINELLTQVDYAFLDATFFEDGEISRPMSEVPHPFVEESIKRFESLATEEKNKIYFIHLNHTNPARDAGFKGRVFVEEKGYNFATFGMRFSLD